MKGLLLHILFMNGCSRGSNALVGQRFEILMMSQNFPTGLLCSVVNAYFYKLFDM